MVLTGGLGLGRLVTRHMRGGGDTSRRYRRWEQSVLVLTQRMDNVLLRLVVVTAVILLGVQIILRSTLFLAVFSRVDRLEGAMQPSLSHLAPWERFLAERTVGTQKAMMMSITLELLQPKPTSKIQLLVNGQIVGDFCKKTLTLEVNAGDLLEIDALEVSDTATIRVIGASPEINSPVIGQCLQASREIRPLGRIEPKSSR